MLGKRPELRRGRIIWATVRDRNQIAKKRPVIVITSSSDISHDEPLEVMAITTAFSEPPPDDCIQLPWHPSGKTTTRLRKRSAAVVSWLDEVHPKDILSFEGDIPPQIMIEILRRLNK